MAGIYGYLSSAQLFRDDLCVSSWQDTVSFKHLQVFCRVVRFTYLCFARIAPQDAFRLLHRTIYTLLLRYAAYQAGVRKDICFMSRIILIVRNLI